LQVAPAEGADAARLTADLAVCAYQRGQYGEMRGFAQRISAGAGTPRAVVAAAAVMSAVGEASVGAGIEIDGRVRRCLSTLQDTSDEELGAWAELLGSVAWGLLAVERLDDGLTVARRVAGAARRVGNGHAALPSDLAAVLAHGLLGRITDALQASDEAEQAARLTCNDQLLQWTLWLRAWVLMEHGDLDEALAAARESAALAARLDDSASATVAQAVLGATLIERGDPASGRALVAAYAIDDGWICRWSPTLVAADLATGDHAAAREHAARVAVLAPGTGMAGAIAAAMRAQALVALVADADGTRAAELARGAATSAAGGGAHLEEARACLVAGRALAASDRAAAGDELRAAEAGGLACGARRVTEEAVRELRRLGVRRGRGGARARGGEGLDALSGREREIAGLVAEGLTNREIGARLYLSEKTIETHLSRVFGKLAVRSRAEVAARVAAS